MTSVHNDSQGLPTQWIDPLNHSIGISYRGADIASITDGLGRTSSAFTDELGRVIQTSDPLGNHQSVVYDAMDRATTIVDPLGNQTTLWYDQNGNLTSVVDPSGSTYKWFYDARNRVHTYTDPDGNVRTFNYDGLGNLTSSIDAKNQLTQYTYDGLDRLATVTYADNSALQITWDGGNRATLFADSLNGNVARTYNGLDQLTDETTPQGEVGYIPDALGRRTKMTVVGQSQPIQYGYDNANRLRSIAQGTTSVGINYDNANRLSTLTLPNGIVQTYGFDAANELTTISYDLGSTHVGDLAYGYDTAGRRTGRSGSLASLVAPTAVSGATFDSAHRLTGWNGKSPSYDANGNLTAIGSSAYGWNVRDQLISTSDGNATFSYDAVGRRVGSTISGASSTYQYDGLNPVMVNGSLMLGGLGLDQHFGRINSGGVTSFLTDDQGSTLELTNSSAATSATYAYGPYGNASASGSDSTPFQYTGRENDGATNLYYYRARYYNPTIGRFISSDPLVLGGGINPYAYVGGDPISYVDPQGLIKIPDIPGSYGETSVHANPGPEATVPGSRMEHDPPHIHLGSNDGPSVLTSDFTPYSAKDAARMTPKQLKFCKNLSDASKNLIRLRQSQIFRFGKVLSALAAARVGVDSLTTTCGQDPFFCIDNLSESLIGYANDHGIPIYNSPQDDTSQW